MGWYIGGMIAVLVIWIILTLIDYIKDHKVEIKSSEVVYVIFTMIFSWVGIAVNAIAFLIWWGIQNNDVIKLKKKDKEDKL